MSSSCGLTRPRRGKWTRLNARFRDHTNRLFEKHGMTIIGFWMPTKQKERRGETHLYPRLSEQGRRRQKLEGVPRRSRMAESQGGVREGRQAARQAARVGVHETDGLFAPEVTFPGERGRQPPECRLRGLTPPLADGFVNDFSDCSCLSIISNVWPTSSNSNRRPKRGRSSSAYNAGNRARPSGAAIASSISWCATSTPAWVVALF